MSDKVNLRWLDSNAAQFVAAGCARLQPIKELSPANRAAVILRTTFGASAILDFRTGTFSAIYLPESFKPRGADSSVIHH